MLCEKVVGFMTKETQNISRL